MGFPSMDSENRFGSALERRAEVQKSLLRFRRHVRPVLDLHSDLRADYFLANSATSGHTCSMKFTEFQKYTDRFGARGETAAQRGIEAESGEFTAKMAEI